MSEKKGSKKKWRPPLKPATEKEKLAQKAKNDYKKLLRKSEFKNFKSEVLGEKDKKRERAQQNLEPIDGKQQNLQPQKRAENAPKETMFSKAERQQQQNRRPQKHSENAPKETMFSKAERQRKKSAKAKAEAKEKSREDAESRRKAIEKYEENKKKNFKRLSKKTKKGQPHMGSQMEVLLAKIQKQMQ